MQTYFQNWLLFNKNLLFVLLSHAHRHLKSRTQIGTVSCASAAPLHAFQSARPQEWAIVRAAMLADNSKAHRVFYAVIIKAHTPGRLRLQSVPVASPSKAATAPRDLPSFRLAMCRSRVAEHTLAIATKSNNPGAAAMYQPPCTPTNVHSRRSLIMPD